MPGTSHRHLLDSIVAIARRAGEEIIAIRRAGFDVRHKEDASPVTAADHAAEAIIVVALRQLTPGVPVVAEEEVAAGRRVAAELRRFWLVDPLDGTKEFVANSDEFTVNIALIENFRPVLGVVGAPARRVLYAACGPGTATCAEGGAPPRAIAARTIPATGAVIVASRSHGDRARIDALVRDIGADGIRVCGSSLKFCLIAAGEADLYPRYGNTCEWDTAAGHAVLLGAGGSVRTTDGAELVYGKPDFLNPEFIARGRDAARD